MNIHTSRIVVSLPPPGSRLPVACAVLAAMLAAVMAAPAEAQTRPHVIVPPNARPLGMGGAHRAVVDSNDALYLNPAGISQSYRYHVESGYNWNQYLGKNVFHISALDSETASPLGAALGFTFLDNDRDTFSEAGGARGWELDFGLCYPAFKELFVAAAINIYNFDIEPRQPDAILDTTVTAGALWRLHRYFKVAAVGYSLVGADQTTNPRRSAVAANLGEAGSVNISFDWVQDYHTRPKITFQYLLGIEFFLSEFFPLRAGYEIDDVRGYRFFTVGAGIHGPKVGIDFGFQQNLDLSTDRLFATGLALYFL